MSVLVQEHAFIDECIKANATYQTIAFKLVEKYGKIRGLSAASVKVYCQRNNMRNRLHSNELLEAVSQAVYEVRNLLSPVACARVEDEPSIANFGFACYFFAALQHL